ncbi:hypothetical protein Mapa_014864 [Marchantia paleacea]|nr:hypothetical protein Mapa_014864 [Marchantia paleacea]
MFSEMFCHLCICRTTRNASQILIIYTTHMESGRCFIHWDRLLTTGELYRSMAVSVIVSVALLNTVFHIRDHRLNTHLNVLGACTSVALSIVNLTIVPHATGSALKFSFAIPCLHNHSGDTCLGLYQKIVEHFQEVEIFELLKPMPLIAKRPTELGGFQRRQEEQKASSGGENHQTPQRDDITHSVKFVPTPRIISASINALERTTTDTSTNKAPTRSRFCSQQVSFKGIGCV